MKQGRDVEALSVQSCAHQSQIFPSSNNLPHLLSLAVLAFHKSEFQSEG